MRHRARYIAVLVLVLFASADLAIAQRTTAAVYGIVRDSSEAVVPGATIVFTNEATNAEITVVSNDVGEFAANFIPPGRYTVKVEARGFKTSLQKGVDLTAAQQIRFPVTMEVGQISETTTVTSEAPLVQNATATLTDNINRNQLRELPLSRRNWTDLLTLQSGIRSGGTGVLQINGLAPAGITATVDGVDSSGNTEGNILSMFQGYNFINIISLEAIAEVAVSKGVMSAEVGRAFSGNINLITKGGTNQFHGSLFENWQNNILNARSFFATRRPLVRFHQFGGSLGGPVIKDRLFFFFAYEGYRQKNESLVSGLVPTPEFKAQAIAAVPAYKAGLDIWPNPTETYPAGAISALYRGPAAAQNRDNHVVARGDYQLNSANQLTTRYTRGRPFQISATLPSAYAREYVGSTDSSVVTWTRAAASWTSETRFGLNFNDTSRVTETYRRGLAGFNVQGHFSFNENELMRVRGHSYSIEEVIALNKGRHTIKAGGMYMVRAPGRINQTTPVFSYRNAADMLSNTPTSVSFSPGIPLYHGRSWEVGFFVQEDFRFRPDLVLNLGVRYEYYSVITERDGNSYNVGKPYNGVSVPPVFRPPDSAYNNDVNNIMPRVGLSWGIGKNQKTVIRTGFGMTVAPLNFDSAVGFAKYGPNIPGGVGFTGSDITTLNLKYPMTNQQGIEILKSQSTPRAFGCFDEDNPNPYAMQWTLDIQRQLTSTLVLQTSYVGSRGLKLTMTRRYNEPDRITNIRPFPRATGISWLDASDNSSYHAWQLQLRKQLSNDYAMSAHYTWSKSMSISAGDFWQGNNPRVQEETDLRADRSATPFDRTHEFTMDAVYTPALDRWLNAGGALKQFVGGWQITGIFRAQTGAPITISQSNSRELQRPDYAGGDPYLHSKLVTDLFLNKAAFLAVPVSAASGITIRPGNVGNRSLRGPDSWVLNLNVAKRFAIREDVGVQLRMEMFNAPNNANWGGPQTNINSSLFGRITSTQAGRTIQLGGRLEF